MKRIIFYLVIVAVLVMMAVLAANLPPATVAEPDPLCLECLPDESFTTTIGNVTNFEAGASGGVPPYDWLWTVNGDPVASLNNTFSTYTNYTRAFNELGLYTVCVNVTDSVGNWTQCCKNATVIGPLLTIAKIDTPDPVNAGGTLNYTITVTNNGTANATNVTIIDNYDETVLNITDTDGGVDDGDAITWDGGLAILSGGGFLSYNISANVSPTAPVGYIFNTANVTCAEGVSSSISINTTVTGALNLTCNITPNPTKGGHPTSFNVTATGGVGNYSYFWDFGDSVGNSTDEDPIYTYAINYTTARNYTVCVNVTDSSEPKQEKQCCVNVTVNKALSLECGISPNTTRVDQAINCTAGASGGVGNYTWLWTVNGTEVATTQNIIYNFTAVNHTAGIYKVCVNVTDSLDNKQQCCTNVTVNPALSLVLSPKTDVNLVGTFHLITATVYDQFDDPKPSVNLTWSISGVGNFSGTPGDITNGEGQAYTEITSSTAGTSIVTCAVVGNPSVSDTATKVWTVPKRPSGGGGGGCPPIKYLTVDWDGKNTTKRLRENDELALELLGPSPDGRHSLFLEQGTHAPTIGEVVYYLITIRELELEDILHLPENTEAIMAFNVTPAGAVFDRDIFLTLGFYQSQFPEDALEETITIAYYGDVSGWVPLESTEGERDSMLTLSAAIDHLNIFAVLVEVTPSPPSPARFVVSGLNIEPSVETGIFVTKTGESVTITANIANDGGQEGTYTVELKLDGETIDTEIVTLSAGQSQQVSFTVSGLDYGQHDVEVDGLSDEFTTSRTITWWLIIVIIVAVGLIIWGVIWFRRRRKARKAA